MGYNDLLGFDLGPTILGYAPVLDELLARLPTGATDETQDTIRIEAKVDDALCASDVRSLIELFPEAARERSTVTSVQWDNPLWFAKGTTAAEIQTTSDVSNALHPMTIIPSFIRHRDQKGEDIVHPALVKASDIFLFRIDPGMVSLGMRRLIASQGLVHELAHGIVSPCMYTDVTLQFEEGRPTDSLGFIAELTGEMDRIGPISHYSSTFWIDGKLPTKGQQMMTAIDEELVELITAYLLGFVMRPDGEVSLTPFYGRESQQVAVETFLKAQLHA